MSSSSSPPPRQAHVLLVSAPMQGHVNPLLVLGRRLASRGLLVTFSTVPHAGLKFPHAHGGGDDGASLAVGERGGGLWAPYDPRYGGFGGDVMRHLVDAAPEALAALIWRQPAAGRPPVTYVMANAFVPWAVRVAGDMGIPRALLWTESCAVLSLFYHHFHALADFPSEEAGAGPDDAPPVAVPGLPPMAAGELPGLIHAPEHFVWRQVLDADLRSLRDDTVSWLLVNTFDELERPAIQTLRSHLAGGRLAVTPVGPLLDTETEEHHGGGDDDDGCMAWLDAQPPGSVVFAAFGSIMKLGRDEMTELAAGLAGTGRPFLLVVRDGNRKLLLPDDDDDDDDDGDCLAAATGTGGKVVAWCDQARVLSHGAVGCFVTHCGWNSAVEALASGVPVVTYPAWADQPTNAKFLEDMYGIGVRLPRPMARGALRRCVEEVMGGGPKAAEMRARAGEWKDAASAALATGGSSERGIQDFVDAVLCTVVHR